MSISKPDMELARARVRVHKVPWLPRHGLTIGKHVFVTMRYDLLLWHETAHTVQYSKEGIIKFLAKYTVEYIWGLLRTRSHEEAYHNISYEVEAREAADMMTRYHRF